MIKKLEIKEKKLNHLWEWKNLEFNSGKLAPQSDWSVVVSLGDTTILVTAVMNPNPNEESDFLPLTIDFKETYYAWWKIWWPQYQKREWKPSDFAILAWRLVDRPIRPMFPSGMVNDIVVSITALSADKENNAWVPAIIWASLAIMLAGIPFEGPVGAVRLWYKDWNFIINPTYEEVENWVLDIVIAWSRDTITMVECWSKEVSSDIIMKAFQIAQEEIKKICDLQTQFISQFEIETREIKTNLPWEEVMSFIKSIITKDKLAQLFPSNKKRFSSLSSEYEKEVMDAAKEKIEDTENKDFTKSKLKIWVFKVIKEAVRSKILNENSRVDWRNLDEVRPLFCEVWVFPRIHWTWLFQRWETQVLSVTTLWAPWDVLILDTMEYDEEERRFMHHYNMPPFSTNEARSYRWAWRREIGHWRLAEKALEYVIPTAEEFPYTIRVVSEVLSSNWSTSMASVCASTLSLMDAWVPIKKPVSWIAMGLVTDENLNYKILTDIQWVEDFTWDMDFKVAGTENGITALQMDMKIPGLKLEIIENAIKRADEWRLQILWFMLETLNQPRENINQYAPKIVQFKINPVQIKDVIGPGWGTINEIIKQTWVKIDFKDDGTTIITAKNSAASDEAVRIIRELTWSPTVWDIIEWTITRIENYWLFVSIGKNKTWLCHSKNLGLWSFVADPRIYFKEGDKIRVKITGIEDDWKIQLKKED